MPEYSAPGVYVEEISFRAKSIEGVNTTTTGFVGPTRYGPIDLEPEFVTSLSDFERIYGDGQQLSFRSPDGSIAKIHNFLWHAARSYFEEGGKRLFIARVFHPAAGNSGTGCAEGWLPKKPQNDSEREKTIRVRARFPGDMGNMQVRLTLHLGPNVLSRKKTRGGYTSEVKSLLDGDLVWISDLPGASVAGQEKGDYYIARLTAQKTWYFDSALTLGNSAPPLRRNLDSLVADPDPKIGDKIKVVTLTVTAQPKGADATHLFAYDGIALQPGHKRAGMADSLFDLFATRPATTPLARQLPIVVEQGVGIRTGTDVLKILFNCKPKLRKALDLATSSDEARSIDLLLEGGNDGMRPLASDYAGSVKTDGSAGTGLKQFENIEDISIVAAPGSTFDYESSYRVVGEEVIGLLISHAEMMRYRIAILDCGDNQSIAAVRSMRSRFDSRFAAFYYPWVRMLDPVTRQEVNMPPSGFVAGIYVRNDIARGVYKAPANEVVNLAIGFEKELTKGEQDLLNPEGINCFRFFAGRGFRLWGARLASSDPEWKYVNQRRYFAYLERSIDKGTQWAVFEPNGEILWANIKRTIEDFLLNEWQSGALLGDKPEKAYFVRCDRSTMTQNDLDSGRLICLIGVAPLRPAEFVIFRIGQWTADRKG